MTYSDITFLATIKPYILTDMRKTGILASLTAAQAFIESNKGNSGLTQECNNLFGIKGEYNGQSGVYLTTEYYNGVPQKVHAKFRKYPSWAESIADHSGLFNRMDRYKNLRGLTDYKKACEYVQKDGYATSPTYSKTLLNIINKYKLYLWDEEITGKRSTVTEADATPTLKKGDQNDYVYHWQKFLNLNGYKCGNEDGIFGNNTEAAVKQWQQAHGLKPDGIIGPATWASLQQ